MCQLLTAIPRDDAHNSELWTTVDRSQNGLREKATLKLIQVRYTTLKLFTACLRHVF